jgi:hypothetical protein
MALPAKQDQSIPLAAASVLTANYRNSSPSSPIIAAGFWKENILAILNQTGCVAIRIYYGLNTDGSPTPVLVGVDERGNDLTGGIMDEFNFPCPPYCGAPNPLNS